MNELPFEDWWSIAKIKIATAGLPPLEEELAVLSHREGLSPDQLVEAYRAELDGSK